MITNGTAVKCEACKGVKGGKYIFTVLGWLCEACHRGYVIQGIVKPQ